MPGEGWLHKVSCRLCDAFTRGGTLMSVIGEGSTGGRRVREAEQREDWDLGEETDRILCRRCSWSAWWRGSRASRGRGPCPRRSQPGAGLSGRGSAGSKGQAHRHSHAREIPRVPEEALWGLGVRRGRKGRGGRRGLL